MKETSTNSGISGLSATHYEQDLVCLLTGRRVAHYLLVLPHGPAYYTWHLQKNVLLSRTTGGDKVRPLHCWFSIWLTEAQPLTAC